LNANFNDTALSNFFEKWGTHTLISYNKGGALEYVATGHSTGELFSANAEIESELSSSANFAGIFEAESTQALSVKMATEFKTSPKYFSNYFKREFSVGFSEYLSNVRISHAKRILSESNLPLSAVGEKVGYTNPVTFAVAFKKRVGMPPGKFREING